MLTKVSWFLILIVTILAIKSVVMDKDNQWSCNTEVGFVLASVLNDQEPDMAHAVERGTGVVVQCRKLHFHEGIYDADWYEYMSVYAETEKELQDNKIDLVDDNVRAVFTAVKGNKHHCLVSGESGIIDFENGQPTFSEIALKFGEGISKDDKDFCSEFLLGREYAAHILL